ncbi:pilus assembly protein PilP [Bdellovibrio svalbardensis]|uniref:Pilus assembly protein PilP n=1 Tax=Bdellovibrio svalbardensis TaxID=2972972 RepID=A0ABT6DIN8_9BACT|nr:pilus assembly protein PilP [Bdellovibrio svalbardensis]MDG0816719.1 pilus assembly protein PilP [Bdellovibrio svalbardensis]
MKSVRWMMSYILVASLGLWLAFAVSMKFMAPAHSQEAPSSGDLPPEFLKEVEATQVPAAKTGVKPAASPTPGKAAPPAVPPSAPKAGEAQQVPPPPPTPTEEMPLGDSVTAPQATTGTMPRDEYIYDPTGKRDPFKPFRMARPTGKVEKTEVPLEPLQRWEVDRLQIVGILWDVKTPRAMVKDPDGAVYTVVKNSKIGRSEGFVAAIREGEIVVVETKYDDGKATKETRVMEFKK